MTQITLQLSLLCQKPITTISTFLEWTVRDTAYVVVVCDKCAVYSVTSACFIPTAHNAAWHDLQFGYLPDNDKILEVY